MWHGIKGHDENVERFRRAVSRGRIGGTYLFLGPPGIGKKLFALKFAQTLLCEKHPAELFDPCEACASCLQVISRTHPDVMFVSRPPEKSFIPLETLIGERGQRNVEGAGLIGHLALKPYSGRFRIGIIDDADYFNAEGANALLKTLEEPPPQALLILIGTSASKQLPTIRSRSQIVRFRPLPVDILTELILEEGLSQNLDEARRLAQLSGGSLERARDLADPEMWPFWVRWRAELSGISFDAVTWSQEFRTFVDNAGKEAAARRKRLYHILSFTANFLRDAITLLVGGHADDSTSAECQNFVRVIKEILGPDAVEVIQHCVETCLQACEDIERNANLTILIDDWITTLWHCLNRSRVASPQSPKPT
ncbi:MAG TPA: DNA polymerase III subunit [Thermogutta sp.]|nr:DNA polymerase III subunit [Thermogutta sp.]HPU05650.1 DNA polymerase III subunit [Thermogutta sp.]HPZ83679.1 DNA polymerase III subunit [Thermogutta sp.]